MNFGEDAQNASCDFNHKTNLPLNSKQKVFAEFSENRSLPSSYYECQGQLLRDDQVFNDILEETGRETLRITLDIQHKDHKEINKQFQATLMNYYLESYISPLLIQHMGLMYKREVFRKMKELAEKQMVEKQKKYIVLMNLFCQKIEQSQQTKEYVNILFEAISKPSPNSGVPQLEYCTFYRQRLCALILLQHYYTIQRDTEYQNFYCFWHKLFEDKFPILLYIMEDKQLRKKLRMNTGIRVQAVPSLRNYIHKKQNNKNNIQEKGSSNSCQQMNQKTNSLKSSKLHNLNKQIQSDEKIFKARIDNQRQSKKLQQTCQDNQEIIQRKRQKVKKTKDQLTQQLDDDDNDDLIEQNSINSAQKNIDCKIQNQFVKEVSFSNSKFKQQNMKQQEQIKGKNLNKGESHLSKNEYTSNIYQINEECQNKSLDLQFKPHQNSMQQSINDKSNVIENQSAANKAFSLEKLAKRSKPRCSIEAGIQGESLLSNENIENQEKSNKKTNQSHSQSSISIIPSSDSFLKYPQTTEEERHYQNNNDCEKNIQNSDQKNKIKLKLEPYNCSQDMEQEEEIKKKLCFKDGSMFPSFKNQILYDQSEEKPFNHHQKNIILVKNLNINSKLSNNLDKLTREQYDDKGARQIKSQTTVLKSEEQIADIQNQLTSHNSNYSAQQRFKNIMNSKLSEESTFMNSPQTNGQVFSFLESSVKEETQKSSEFKLGPSLVSSQNYLGQVQQCNGDRNLKHEMSFKSQHIFNQKYPQISSNQVQNQLFEPNPQRMVSQNNPAIKFEQQISGNVNFNQINNPLMQIGCDNQIKVINMSQAMLEDQLNNQQYQQYLYHRQQAQYESMQQQLLMNNYMMKPQYQPNIILNDQAFNNNRLLQGAIFQGSNANNNKLYQNNFYCDPNIPSQIISFGPSTNDFQQMLMNNQQCYFRSLIPSERAYNPQNQRFIVIQQVQQ
ncbi:hypothetical protein ABPG74_018477 [Tetrahymena malaccensis]